MPNFAVKKHLKYSTTAKFLI